MHVCLITKLDNFFQNRIKCNFKKNQQILNKQLKFCHSLYVITGDFGGCPESHLEEGQAVLVLTPVLVTKVEVVEGPAQWGWLGHALSVPGPCPQGITSQKES